MEETAKKQSAVEKAKLAAINVIDENGNGKIDLEDVIIKGLKTPGIKINRAEFLAKTLKKRFPQETIDAAIAESPMRANIAQTEIDKMANEAINFERTCVSGISAALSAPGGVAMVATVPADLMQYYAYLLRMAQKLLYLYGFPQIDTEETGEKFDDGTMNTLILCFGVMYGVAGANKALLTVARALGAGLSKKFMQTAVTKGTIYPVLKAILKCFNVKLTKQLASKAINHSLPVIGGVIGGGITFFSFKSCGEKLKKTLRDTYLSNPDYQPPFEDNVTKNASDDSGKTPKKNKTLGVAAD